MMLARTYIGGITGASARQIGRIVEREGLIAAAARRPGPCPLAIPVTGRVAGRPWREAIDFTETATLMRHLGTAVFIVRSFLTGIRPREVLGLRTGCCTDPEPDAAGRVGRHLIRGHEYKTATDEHGNHQSAGEEREVPWVAIAPVVHAIRVLERIVPDGALLFDRNAHDLHCRGIKDTPRLDHRVPGCDNITRTDHHASQLRNRADVLDKQAAHTPQPIGDRLRANADRLRAHADSHHRTRLTLQESDA
jgi:hypothetical protein